MKAPALLFFFLAKFVKATEIASPVPVSLERDEQVKEPALERHSVKVSLLDILKNDSCQREYKRFFSSPIKFPADPEGLNRYPLHYAIMYKSYRCVQVITHCTDVYGLGGDDTGLAVLNHEDYLGRKAIHYAIKYFPLVAVKCLTHKMLNDEKIIETIIKSTLYENPLPHIDLLATITLKSKSPEAIFVQIMKEFINSENRNSFVYETFLDYYLNQIFCESNSDSSNGTYFDKAGISLDKYYELYILAIEKGCYPFLKASFLLKKLHVSARDVRFMDKILSLIRTAAGANDAFVVKHTMKTFKYIMGDQYVTKLKEHISASSISDYFLENFELDENIQESDLYSKEYSSGNLNDKENFFLAIRSAFDLDFILPEPTENISDRDGPFVKIANDILNVLEKKTDFEDLSAEMKTDYLNNLPRFILNSVPLDFVIALHNPSALQYLPDDRIKDLINTPVYEDDYEDVNRIPSVLDLIACYTPEAYPMNLIKKEVLPMYVLKSIKFVNSSECPVADEIKSQFMFNVDVKTILKKNLIETNSSWTKFKVVLSDKSTHDIESFIATSLSKNNCEFAYRTALSRNIKLSLINISTILYTANLHGKREVFDYVVKFVDLGFREGEILMDVLNLQVQILNYWQVNDRSAGVLLIKLWQLNPAIVNMTFKLKPKGTEHSLFRFFLTLGTETAFDVLHSLCTLENLEISAEDFNHSSAKLAENPDNKQYRLYNNYAKDKRQGK